LARCAAALPRAAVRRKVFGMIRSETCWACGGPDFRPFFELRHTPVSVGVLWRTAEAARSCARGDIRLAFCRACGFIGNAAFDPARLDYTGTYDNSLHHSPLHRAYARDLAARLIERYAVRQKVVIELGCGKGDFLKLLCEMGDNRGIGFDPSRDGGSAAADDRVRFVHDFYAPRYADCAPDLICCRHVFEHLAEPRQLLSMLRETIDERRGTVLYFEVPNVRTMLRDLCVWSIIYEHCAYFSAESLARLFASCGFDVREVCESYAGQFLGIEATPAAPNRTGSGGAAGDLQDLAHAVDAFAERFENLCREWKARLTSAARAGTRIAAWGAGARTVGVFNALELGAQIPVVVDLNPNKHGTYLTGTGQPIVAPEFLRDYRPGVILIINGIYEAEIRAHVRQLGLEPEFVVLETPADGPREPAPEAGTRSMQ
jgi:SAM-dependent methyltransferase